MRLAVLVGLGLAGLCIGAYLFISANRVVVPHTLRSPDPLDLSIGAKAGLDATLLKGEWYYLYLEIVRSTKEEPSGDATLLAGDGREVLRLKWDIRSKVRLREKRASEHPLAVLSGRESALYRFLEIQSEEPRLVLFATVESIPAWMEGRAAHLVALPALGLDGGHLLEIALRRVWGLGLTLVGLLALALAWYMGGKHAGRKP